jgi:hypothetical protein
MAHQQHRVGAGGVDGERLARQRFGLRELAGLQQM